MQYIVYVCRVTTDTRRRLRLQISGDSGGGGGGGGGGHRRGRALDGAADPVVESAGCPGKQLALYRKG